ncbi:MAG TPA: DUF4178 domain-containing protein [Fimbriiglobus sp.]|nr:DUF4178 domain-containing protein [Fimbriiglobus sp.]
MSVRVACPGCGGPVVFEVGSALAAVCPQCRSVVARGDRSVENLGKVAELVETGAVLKVGLTGRYDGAKFQLTGRTQLGHEAGGVWDEWYADFGGRWGWLAESQGRFHMTFERPGAGDGLPEYTGVDPGRSVTIDGTRYVVAEEGLATVLSAEGELPFRLEPGRRYAYADLSGPDGAFATLDYSQRPPAVYVGREVTLDELHVPHVRRETFELRQVAGRKLSCPQCGGRLELRAPDRTERVGCPYCGSLLDCTEGDLKLLNALEKPAFDLVLPIGSVGKFGDDERTVIGALLRSVTFDKKYYWQEYLLYHPRDGFEWLVWSDGHWSRVRGVPAGEVDFGVMNATYDGRSFRIFQRATATVRGVVGECYWKVAIKETAETADFVRPPEMLSCEKSQFGESTEVNWSLGTYLTPREVQTAFGLPERLPAPIGVGPNQPFPYTGVYRVALWAFVALLGVGLVLWITLPSGKVYEKTFPLQVVSQAPLPKTSSPAAPAPPSGTQVFFTDLFELKGHRNVRVKVSYPQLSGWAVVEADLVQQSSGNVQPFLVPLTYYSGTEGGEAWTEGEKSASEYLAAQPAGQYSLRLAVEREKPTAGGTMTVVVEQGVPHFRNWFYALIGIGLIPVGVGVYNLMFSMRRWKDSDFSPYPSSE